MLVDGIDQGGDEPAAPDVTAESSPAEGVEKSMLDAVQAALEPSKEDAPTSEEAGKEPLDPDAAETGPKGEGEDEEGLTEDELKQFSKRAQHRFRELVTGKNEAEAKLAELAPKAEHLDRILTHLRTHNIPMQEFDNAIEITRLVKHEPDKALEIVGALYQSLAQRTGRVIPKEMLERVNLGHLSEQDALKMAQLEAREADRLRREEEAQERTAEEKQRTELQSRVQTAVSAVDEWAKAKAGSDPDWTTKQQDVADQVELELGRVGIDGYPKTKAEAVAMAVKALKVVEDRQKSLRPKPQERRPATGQAASPRAQAAPENMLDAIEIGLAKTANG